MPDIDPRLAPGHAKAWVNGELRAGQRVITGSIVQVPVRLGDRVEVAFGDEASIGLTIGQRA